MPNMVELGALAKTLAPIINNEVEKAFSGLLKRIESLESRPAMTDEVREGIVKDAAAEVAGQIPTPKDGEDGKSVTVEDVEPILKEYIDGILAFIPPPEKGEKGEDGESVSIEEVSQIVSEAVDKAVSEAVEKSVSDAVSKIEIPAPKDGLDGKDALQIEILPSFDESKSYPRGTYAQRDGGIWRAWQQTEGLKGWEPVTQGFPTIEHDIVDDRTLVVRIAQTGREAIEKRYSLPVMIYRGTWTQKTYQKGDTVTSGGSLWHCDVDNNDNKPGTQDSGWRLCAKKGRDGAK